MSKLIQALQIFLKYGDPKHPTHCGHDMLMVCGYDQERFSQEDIESLEDLGFTWHNDYDCFVSFKYGSC